MSDSNELDFKLYRYTPAIAPAALFVALFALTTLFHTYQLIRGRAWYFIAFVIGGIFQIIGYICRVLAHDNTQNVPIYSIMTILILLAPPLYAVSVYIVLGRLIVFLRAEKLSVVPVKWMTKIFVVGDIIGFLAQAAGGGIMASGTISSYKLGEHITVAGLAVQLLFFSFFMVTCVTFHYRIRKNPTAKVIEASGHGNGTPTRTWEVVLFGLYTASILILVRSIFRLIEYAQGNSGYLISHEVFMYIFDAALMFLAMLVMNICHPTTLLGGSREKHDDTLMESLNR